MASYPYPYINISLADPSQSFFNSSEPLWSLDSPAFTYVAGKYSCVKEVYALHILFSYIISISGILCFLTRVIPQVKFMHVWLGKIYIVSMLACTFTSLLIHNEGLPLGVIYSFVLVFFGLFLGWFVIAVHQDRLTRQAHKNIQAAMLAGQLTVSTSSHPDFLDYQVAMEKDAVVANQTITQRLFSLRTLHGVLMTVSWINIFGRTLVTDVNFNFACYTYPVYKPLDVMAAKRHNFASNSTLSLLHAGNDGNPFPWGGWEGGWFAMMFFVPAIVSFIVAAIYSVCIAKIAQKKSSTYPSSTNPNVTLVEPLVKKT